MPLDPILVPLMEGYPETPRLIEDYPAFRASSRANTDALVTQLSEAGPYVADVHDTHIPVKGGTIRLRIYRPASETPLPVHLYFHGGGFAIGSVDDLTTDITCRERAALADHVVVSVDYRLAPEHQFPVAIEDAFAALSWAYANAERIGGRADLISIGGCSAGGNIAAALALMVRDLDGPAITLQLLEVPLLDFDYKRPSHESFGAGYALSTWDAQIAREDYLPSSEDARNPYASPLQAEDLTGLPPAVILSAEFDILCDDGAAYAERLNAAGGTARFSLQEGQVHVSSAITAISPAARAWRAEIIEALQGVAR